MDQSDKTVEPTFIFKDGTRYLGEYYQQLPWIRKVYRKSIIRGRVLAKDYDEWSEKELAVITNNRRLYDFKESVPFDLFFACTIMINTMIMQWRVDSDDQQATFFKVAENVFTIGFLTEWCLQIYVEGFLWITTGTNMFDTFLVWLGGVVPVWILPNMASEDSAFQTVGGIFTILRVFRILRLYRVLRKLNMRDAWLLIKGIIGSLTTFCWAVLLLIVYFYIVATFLRFVMVGSEVVKTDGGGIVDVQDVDSPTYVYIGTVSRIMWFLFASFTDGISWEPVVAPVMEGSAANLWLPFGVFISLGRFVILNLITAVIVENSIEASVSDHEHEAKLAAEERTRIIDRVLAIFRSCDLDNSGEVDRKEFIQMLGTPKMRRLERLLHFDESGREMLELFDLVDKDGSCHCSVPEFKDVMLKIMTPLKAKDIMVLMMHSVRCEAKLDHAIELNALKPAKIQEAASKEGSWNSGLSTSASREVLFPFSPSAGCNNELAKQIREITEEARSVNSYFDKVDEQLGKAREEIAAAKTNST